MPDGEPRGKRPRFKLTGLESPEELWDRIRESGAEIEGLAYENARLAAELDMLRRRMQGAGALSDDELMAELPQRMTRNLAAAQEVADELVERARSDALVIRLNADQVAAQLVDGAQAEVDRIVRGTIAESKAQLATARAKAEELLRSAHAQRARMQTDLDERAAWIEREYQSLDDHRRRLEQAYEQVANALVDARAALVTAAEPAPPVAVERSGRTERAERAGHYERAALSERAAQPERAAVSERSGRAARRSPAAELSGPAASDGRPADATDPGGNAADRGLRPGVFDWSRAAAAPRGGGRPSTPEPAFGDASYAGADAAAG